MRTAINKKRGYTIIETMISIALFIIIILAGMNALLNANLLHQKSQNMRSIMDNLSFVMEDMSRNMRTGSNFHCVLQNDPPITSTSSPVLSQPQSCTSGWAVAFEFASGVTSNYDDQWVYYVDNTGKIFRATTGPYVQAAFVQMTPDEVVITSAYPFSVLGAGVGSSDNQQPLIGIKLVGTITIKNVVTPFSIQTSVSQRVVDI
ncbi:MAG: prepilin-type N-terminal cleavage/methylation domain-containing protein [Candidatus Paceibacterota bacterium]